VMPMLSPFRCILLVGCVSFGTTVDAGIDDWLKAAGDCAKHTSPDARRECEAKQKAALEAFKKGQERSSLTSPSESPAAPNDLCFTHPQTGVRMCPN
jgi:hypothetical protein